MCFLFNQYLLHLHKSLTLNLPTTESTIFSKFTRKLIACTLFATLNNVNAEREVNLERESKRGKKDLKLLVWLRWWVRKTSFCYLKRHSFPWKVNFFSEEYREKRGKKKKREREKTLDKPTSPLMLRPACFDAKKRTDPSKSCLVCVVCVFSLFPFSSVDGFLEIFSVTFCSEGFGFLVHALYDWFLSY